MFAVLFEVEPKTERWDDYLRHAAMLRPELLKIDGFLDNRRFASRRRPGTLLSLSYWQDEKAVIRWRTHALHRQVQAAGREHVFRDYHLRVGEVARDGGILQPRTRHHGISRAASVIEGPTLDDPPGVSGLADWDRFDGITVPGSALILLSWTHGDAMNAWEPAGGERRTDVAIVRDYGMRDRREAPQYFPPVPG